MACNDKCCDMRVSDMRPNEIEPVIIDANDWLESVGSRTLTSATWVSVAAPDDTGNLTIAGQSVSRGDNTAQATLSGGTAGRLYEVTVTLESCEGYQKQVCFTQYVLDC